MRLQSIILQSEERFARRQMRSVGENIPDGSLIGSSLCSSSKSQKCSTSGEQCEKQKELQKDLQSLMNLLAMANLYFIYAQDCYLFVCQTAIESSLFIS